MRTLRNAVLAVSLGFFACGGATMSNSPGPVLSPSSADAPVAVYMAGQVPNVPYLEVGEIRIRTHGSTLQEMIAEAQAQAQQLGANAVLIDFRYHYQSLPIYYDAAGNPYLPPTPKPPAERDGGCSTRP